MHLQVLYAKDNVAIIQGLNNDADVGTYLAFSSGARGCERRPPPPGRHNRLAATLVSPCTHACMHSNPLIILLNPPLLPLCSVMLWRRCDNIVFALLLGGGGLVGVGDGVQCQVTTARLVQFHSQHSCPGTSGHLDGCDLLAAVRLQQFVVQPACRSSCCRSRGSCRWSTTPRAPAPSGSTHK